jgi:threonine synthase
MTDHAFQHCIIPACGQSYAVDDVLFACRKCGALLDVRYDWDLARPPDTLSFFDARRAAATGRPGTGPDSSGVWRFRELLPFARDDDLATIGEGRTLLQQADELAAAIGIKPGRLFLQYEGFNPSGSFKDNGMAAAFTIARRLGKRRVACASTGNTSASLALYAHHTAAAGQQMEAVVFVGGGKIALGKLAQALDYGARTLQIEGDFDTCMELIQRSAHRLDLYVMNSVNPFRLEGQKTIIYRVLEGLNWEVPDWIIVPGGNLGNSSAFGKALVELRDLGLIDRLPRLAIINAEGANTLYELYNDHHIRFDGGKVGHHTADAYFAMIVAEGRSARTVASAIEIGRPVNLIKALRSLEWLSGVVEQVADEVILDGKALVGRYGYGCEPASGASIAGLRRLLDTQVISPTDRVVCILTGHGLKDPQVTVAYHTDRRPPAARAFPNPPVAVAADIEAIESALSK